MSFSQLSVPKLLQAQIAKCFLNTTNRFYFWLTVVVPTSVIKAVAKSTLSVITYALHEIS